MPYATASQLQAFLGDDDYLALVDRDGDDAADTATVDQALASASGWADGYIARYLPITTPPDGLVQAVIDVAVYRLAGNDATEDQRKRYEDARRWLEMVAAGRISLGPIGVGAEEDVDIAVEGPDQVFGREQTGGLL